jgi:hypothetical protein
MPEDKYNDNPLVTHHPKGELPPPLFRTSRPPKVGPLHHDVYENVHPHQLHHDKVMPHMLPHSLHHDEHKTMPHMLPHHNYEDDGKTMPHMLPKGHHGPPPSLPQYVPPPLSTHAEGYGKPVSYGYASPPQYMSTEYRLPPQEYLPVHHQLHPKQYLTTNPIRYQGGYKKPSYESNLPEDDDVTSLLQTLRPPKKDYIPPSEINAPIRADGYLPPPEPTTGYKPPDKDYLHPGDIDDPNIPPPPEPEALPVDIDDGLPSRGPQSPVSDQFRLGDGKYAKPPHRPVLSDFDEVRNSQVLPPTSSKEHYIPPKTKFDVPKNFLRPEDVVPELSDIDDFGTIDILDAELLPDPPNPDSVQSQVGIPAEQLTEQPFFGLAKLIDPERKKSLQELEDLKVEVQKLAKLVQGPEGPSLPPMPTVAALPPQPSSFVPFLEKLQPSVLQQLQANIRDENNGPGAGRGKIPGKPGVDYPDFKTIPATDFSCENFILEGFYADTFTSCQVNFYYIVIFKVICANQYICRFSMSVNLGDVSHHSCAPEEQFSIRSTEFVIGGTMSNVRMQLSSMT